MQVAVETMQGLKRRVTVTIPTKTVNKKLDNWLRKTAQTKHIDGFRQGKAPLKLIEKKYGQPIRHEIAGQLIQHYLSKALASESLIPAGFPEILPADLVKDKDFNFTATFEVYPVINIIGLDIIQVVQPKVEICDADIKKMITTIQQQQAKWQDTDRSCVNGDRVIIDFKGTIDEVAFEGGSADNFEFILGAKQTIPSFDEGVIGKKTGDTFTNQIIFPKDYQVERLREKTANFIIKLKKVKEAIIPELNAAFIKELGIKNGSLGKLQENINRNMQKELTQRIRANIKEQVIIGLLANNDIPAPAVLVKQDIDLLRKDMMQSIAKNGEEKIQQNAQLSDDFFTKQAERRVKIGLLFSEIIKVNELTLDHKRVETVLALMTEAYDDPKKMLDHYKNNTKLYDNICNNVLEEQVIDYILTKAKLTEKVEDFYSFTKRQIPLR